MVNFFLKFSLESKDGKLLHNGADWKRRKVQGRGDKQTFRNRKKQQSSVLLFQGPMQGIYLPKMVWKDMYDFSEDSVLLVLASTHYTADEYVRNFGDYVSEVATYK